MKSRTCFACMNCSHYKWKDDSCIRPEGVEKCRDKAIKCNECDDAHFLKYGTDFTCKYFIATHI